MRSLDKTLLSGKYNLLGSRLIEKLFVCLQQSTVQPLKVKQWFFSNISLIFPIAEHCCVIRKGNNLRHIINLTCKNHIYVYIRKAKGSRIEPWGNFLRGYATCFKKTLRIPYWKFGLYLRRSVRKSWWKVI